MRRDRRRACGCLTRLGAGVRVGAMTGAAKKLPGACEVLPEPERREVASESLRRAELAEHKSLEDAEFVALADEAFPELGRPAHTPSLRGPGIAALGPAGFPGCVGPSGSERDPS